MIREFRGQYGFMSNFAECEINYNGYTYPSTEHAFMAQKSYDEIMVEATANNVKYVDWIEYCATSGKTASEIKAQARTVTLRPDWEQVKLQVMEDVLRIKFNQEPFKSKLLATGNQNIQEGNTWKDVFWGIDLQSGVGENHLGRIIMDIRKELR